jgi:hypothetical protein
MTSDNLLTQDTGNLPTWTTGDPARAYSRAYKILQAMAKRETQNYSRKFWGRNFHPSQEMQDLIEALNDGDENDIKALLLRTHIYHE